MKKSLLIATCVLMALICYVRLTKTEEAKVAVKEAKKEAKAESKAEPAAPAAKTNLVLNVAEKNGLTAFVKAVGKAELAGDANNAKANFIVFAPDDAAFAKAFEAGEITDDRGSLRPVIKYHVVPSKAKVDKSSLTGSLETFAGGPIKVISESSIEDAKGTVEIKASYPADNGMVFVVGRVLKPIKAKE